MQRSHVVWLVMLLGLVACEPYNLKRKDFPDDPTCIAPRAKIGYTADQLDVTFFLEEPEGTIEVVGWYPDIANRNFTRVGNRVTYRYSRPGRYTVEAVINNRCNIGFTTTREITVSY